LPGLTTGVPDSTGGLGGPCQAGGDPWFVMGPADGPSVTSSSVIFESVAGALVSLERPEHPAIKVITMKASNVIRDKADTLADWYMLLFYSSA